MSTTPTPAAGSVPASGPRPLTDAVTEIRATDPGRRSAAQTGRRGA